MKFVLVWLGLVSVTASAYEVEVKVHNTIRKIAGTVEVRSKDEALLVYHSPDARSKDKTYAVDAASWTKASRSGNSRLDMLLKLYYANIKDVSNSGQRHVGCFYGNAEEVVTKFFKNDLPISNIQNIFLSVSEDRKMLGLEFKYASPGKKSVVAHFRLPHCLNGGKTALLDEQLILTAKHGMGESSRMVASNPVLRVPAAAVDGENGYDVFDKLNKDDAVLEAVNALPRFALRADYDQMKPQPEARPWKGMDIRTEEGGRKFAHVVLDYFWDSLVQDTANPNNNLKADKIAKGKVQWCHMPWLNVGDSGREMIHGLTKERDLERSEIYPEVATTKDKEGSDWGIGFYNDIACASVNNVFGAGANLLAVPDFTKVNFPDGSVSVKVLFTTARLEALKDSLAIKANVSLPKSTSRRIREVKMVQIDVAVKDSTLVGVRKEADAWLMTTFYFDASYLAPSRHKFKGALAALSKMRPIGIQNGFDPECSLIFKDSKTNSANNAHFGVSPRLMNGPADNPKGSCLGCHGTAGTTQGMVPGIKDFADYERVRSTTLDFSQQLALAKKNYETRAGQKKVAKGW